MSPRVSSSDKRSSVYWQRTRRLTLSLLAIWLLATFGVIFFARDLYQVTLFGWPLSFYMGAQGILLIYVAIIAVYAWRMHALDKHFNSNQEQDRKHGR